MRVKTVLRCGRNPGSGKIGASLSFDASGEFGGGKIAGGRLLFERQNGPRCRLARAQIKMLNARKFAQ